MNIQTTKGYIKPKAQCMTTPSNMEVFLDVVYNAKPHERMTAPAVVEAHDLLLIAGMIRMRTMDEQAKNPTITNRFTLTEKGNYYLRYILSLPFPEEIRKFTMTPPEID